MRLRERRHGTTLVIRLAGDLDLTELPTVDGRVGSHLAEGVRDVVFDLAEVGLLPSTGVGMLIQVTRRVREGGGRVALAAVPRTVRGTLVTMGVDRLFRTYRDVDAACAALSE